MQFAGTFLNLALDDYVPMDLNGDGIAELNVVRRDSSYLANWYGVRLGLLIPGI